MELLPRDIIRKLLLEYFDPLSALRCIQTAKLFDRSLTIDQKQHLRVIIVKEQILRRCSTKKRDSIENFLFPSKRAENRCRHCSLDLNFHTFAPCPLQIIKCPPVQAQRRKDSYVQCTFEGYRKHVQYHMQHECTLTCKYCQQILNRNDAITHGNDAEFMRCPKQRYGCFFNCGKVVIGDNYEKHKRQCAFTEVQCPNGCGSKFQRLRLSSKSTGQLFMCDMCAYKKSHNMQQQRKAQLTETQAVLAVLKRII